MYKVTIAIGIAAAACLITGCGSTSDETAEAAVSKTQFIKQASAICSKARDKAGKAAATLEETKGKTLDLDTVLQQVIGPALRQEAEELQALTAPEGDEAKVARMVGNLSKGANSMTEGRSSASASEAFVKEATAYGLKACQL